MGTRYALGVSARHILIPVHDFSHGGTERIGFRLAGRWLEAGRRVTILAGAPDGPMASQVPEGADIVMLDPPRPRSPFSRFGLGKPMGQAAKALNPDIIFLIGNFHLVLGSAFDRAVPRAAIVGKISNPLVPPWLGTGIAARAIAASWSGGIDTLVAMSDASNRELSPLVPNRKVVTIRNPFLDDDLTIQTKNGRPGGPLRLLFVGRFEPQKDPLLALDVAEELQRRGVAFSLTMLGAGTLEGTLSEQVARRGLGAAVTLTGNVADPAPYYRTANMLLLTSRFEGVPAVIGEALAHGLPFVATPCSEWVSEIAAKCRQCGVVTSGRSAAVIADALLVRQSETFPTQEDIETAIGQHRLGTAADAYLRLFDSLVDGTAPS